MPLNSSGGAEKTSQLCLSPWGLRGKSGAPLRGGRRPQQLAGSAGPVSGQIPIFKPAAGDGGGGSRSGHLGLPCSLVSQPGQGYRCTVGSQATSSAPGLSSPHPTLPLRYFSMTGAREHFRLRGRVPLAWVYQFLPVAPQLLQSLHHYAPASSRGYPLCQESPGLCRLRKRLHGPAG